LGQQAIYPLPWNSCWNKTLFKIMYTSIKKTTQYYIQ